MATSTKKRRISLADSTNTFMSSSSSSSSSSVHSSAANHTTKLCDLSITDCQCPICFEVFVEPVSTPCGHDICFACLQLLIKKPEFLCPLCRNNLRPWVDRTFSLSSLVNREKWTLIKRKFPDEVQTRLENKTSLVLLESITKFNKYGIKDQNYGSIVPENHHRVVVNQNRESTTTTTTSVQQEFLDLVRNEEERRRERQLEEERLSMAYIQNLMQQENAGQQIQPNPQRQQFAAVNPVTLPPPPPPPQPGPIVNVPLAMPIPIVRVPLFVPAPAAAAVAPTVQEANRINVQATNPVPVNATPLNPIQPPPPPPRVIQQDLPPVVALPDNIDEIRCQIYVENVIAGTRLSSLRAYFAAFGEVVNIDLKESRGKLVMHAFVTFTNIESVDAVMNTRPHQHELSSLECRRVEQLKTLPRPASNSINFDLVSTSSRVVNMTCINDHFKCLGRVKLVTRESDTRFSIEFDDHDAVDRLMLFEREIKIGRSVVGRVARRTDDGESEQQPRAPAPKLTRSATTRTKRRSVVAPV